jgi:hypothetical protein
MSAVANALPNDRDGSIPASSIQKYIMQKLSLLSESEVRLLPIILFSNYFSVLNFPCCSVEIFKQSIDFVVKMLLTLLPEPVHIGMFQNILHLILETKV